MPNKKVVKSFSIEEAEWVQVKKLSARTGIKISAIIRKSIAQFVGMSNEDILKKLSVK